MLNPVSSPDGSEIPHIYYSEIPFVGPYYDVCSAGFYFMDETEGINGPFPTLEEVQAGFAQYCKYLEGLL